MTRSLTLVAALTALSASASAQQFALGEYWPLDTGYTWTYVDSQNPTQIVDSTTVLGMTNFNGQLAWEINEGPGDSLFAGNDGTTFTIYGFQNPTQIVDIPDLSMGLISDGDSFDPIPDVRFVWRDWSQLDHNLTGAYGVDPNLCDVVLLVQYDLSTPGAGSQNVILESGGGTQHPFAIEYIEWYQRGVGPIAGLDFFTDGSFDGPRFDATASFVVGSNYCTSFPNSATPAGTTCGAIIRASGSDSVAANDLVLTSEPTPPGEPGIFYYGPNALGGAPFGDGLRCVGGAGGTVVRIFPFVSANGAGVMSTTIDNTNPANAQITAGATLNFQSWFRDPAANMAGFNLSNGLSITFTP
jgi:hypothetical protein